MQNGRRGDVQLIQLLVANYYYLMPPRSSLTNRPFTIFLRISISPPHASVPHTSNPHIQSLNLNNNRLEVLPDNIGDLPSLVKIDVSNNSIRFLPASMGQFRKIQRIDCSNNLLSK